MRVFVTGATGFIGSAVVKDLIAAGHNVLGLARTDASAQLLTAVGAEVHRGSLEDLDSIKRGATATDGVIHTAFIHDFSNMAASGVVDRQVVAAFGDALEGTNKPLVVTSGIATLTPGSFGTELDAPNPKTAGTHRVPSEELTIALAERGIRSSVMRLPPSVHDVGDYGFVPFLIKIAREKGVSAYIGDGENRWPAVHRLDAAHVFRLAMEKGIAGSRYHGIGEEGIPTRDIAAMIGKQLNIPVVSVAAQDAPAHFGWLGHFFAADCAASSAITREQLGWQPTHPGLIEDLSMGHYF